MVRFFIAVTLTVICFSGCSRYITHYSSPIGIRIGGTADQCDKMVVVCEEEKLRLAVENVLINRGVFVKSIESENIIWKRMENEVGIEKYSYMSTIADALGRKGKIKGSEKMIKAVKEWNDLKDQLIRVEDYDKLLSKKREVIKKVYEFFDIDYILVVSNLTNLSYMAKMISVKNDHLVFTMYTSSNQKGFDRIIPSAAGLPNSDINIESSDKLPDPQYYYIRYANYLASRLLGGGK
jgi:hypothetical protein